MITDFIVLKDKNGNGPVWINPMNIMSMKTMYERKGEKDAYIPCGTKILCSDIGRYHVTELPGEVYSEITKSNNYKLKTLAGITGFVT